MTRHLQTKLACAGALLAVGMAFVTVGAQLGAVHLNAGDLNIVFGRGEGGLTMDIATRSCPPDCGFDVNWRPMALTAGVASR
jgi:hypothetical protein